jgi:5-formyltetrahydrofolate cyclo-ligase
MLAVGQSVGQHEPVEQRADDRNLGDLRIDMLARRKALPPDVVARHSDTVVQRLRSLPEMEVPELIGAYLGVRGEVNPAALLDDPDLRVALPVTTPGQPLQFVVPDGPLVQGPFGIRQPDEGLDVDPMSLAVVLVPLVAADRHGNRIGHGAGFYDRTFAGLIADRSYGPLLIGLCHDIQVVESLGSREWDVPLDLLVTEVGVIRPTA